MDKSNNFFGKKHTKETKQRLRECRLDKPRGTKIGKDISCEICGNKFYVMPYLEKTKKTCSKKCFKIWKINQAKELGYGKWMKGRTNHITKDGKDKLKKLGIETGSKRLKDYQKENGSWNKDKKLSKEAYPRFGWRTSRKYQIFPKKDSSIEVKIQNFLKELGIEFFTHQYMKIENGYQCDILIPSMNLVIECDGDYWHRYPIGRDIDKVRTKELIQKGFKVLRLWEREIRIMNISDFKKKINL